MLIIILVLWILIKPRRVSSKRLEQALKSKDEPSYPDHTVDIVKGRVDTGGDSVQTVLFLKDNPVIAH